MSILTGRCIYIEIKEIGRQENIFYDNKGLCKKRAAEIVTSNSNISAIAYLEYKGNAVFTPGICMMLTRTVQSHQLNTNNIPTYGNLYHDKIRDEEGYYVDIQQIPYNKKHGANTKLLILNYTQTNYTTNGDILSFLPGFEKTSPLYC
jgi:hypothetical protein